MSFQLTSCLFDCYLHLLMCPVVLFPYMAGYTTGPLRHLFSISTHAQMVKYIQISRLSATVCFEVHDNVSDNVVSSHVLLALPGIAFIFISMQNSLQVAQKPNSRWRFRKRVHVYIVSLLYTLTIPSTVYATFGKVDRQDLIDYLLLKRHVESCHEDR